LTTFHATISIILRFVLHYTFFVGHVGALGNGQLEDNLVWIGPVIQVEVVLAFIACRKKVLRSTEEIQQN
jgi:hypothetical protein